MTETSAPSAGELDELNDDLMSSTHPLSHRAADAIAALRKQLDEARAEFSELLLEMQGWQKRAVEAREREAQMAVALRENATRIDDLSFALNDGALGDIADVMRKAATAPASPSTVLRNDVIEECAKAVENAGPKGALGIVTAGYAATIRALKEPRT